MPARVPLAVVWALCVPLLHSTSSCPRPTHSLLSPPRSIDSLSSQRLPGHAILPCISANKAPLGGLFEHCVINQEECIEPVKSACSYYSLRLVNRLFSKSYSGFFSASSLCLGCRFC
jgi:hypothetical protein